MVTFAVSEKNRFYKGGRVAFRLPLFSAFTATAALLMACLPAGAQTTGNGGDAVTLGFLGGLANPSDGKAVDLTKTIAGYIQNPYIQVVSGIGGTFAIVYPNGTGTLSVTYNVAGMLAITNVAGSLRYSNDNAKPLVGNRFDVVSPYASQWETTDQGFVSFDYPSYLRADVDGTVTPFVTFGSERFDPNTLIMSGQAVLNPNVVIRQEVRLFRATAQLRWVMTNQDIVPHTVRLRYAADIDTPFYYQDPARGVSQQPHLYTGAEIPNELFLYASRYEEDKVTNNSNGPFASRFVFRNFGATLPASVLVADNVEFRPNDARFDVTSTRNMERLAVGVYYGPYQLLPGQSAEVVAYYGNGAVTERLDKDYVVAADGPESLGYNAAAADDPAVVGNIGGDPKVIAPKFLTPNPFQIFGGVYNRIPNTPSTSVTLNNVRASLTLPTGLSLGTNPSTNQPDTAEKVLGNNGAVDSDRGSDAFWYVQANGDAYGSLGYQVSVRTNEGGSRQITRTINVPAMPFRAVSPSVFQMLGFPFQFDLNASNNSDPKTVLNGLTTPADDKFQFYRWIPDPNSSTGAGRYEIVNKLENGIGYMFKPSIARTVFAKGVSPYPKQATVGETDFGNTSVKQVSLERGWNIISNPYVYEIPLRYLRFSATSDLNNSQTFQQALNSGLVQSGIFFLNSTGKSYDYFDSIDQPLRPWEAYWIFLTRPIVMGYQLPAQRNSVVVPTATGIEPPTRARRGEIESGRAFGGDPAADEWRLQLVASQEGDKFDKATIIGVTRASKDSKNISLLSVPKPPAPYSDFVYVTLQNSSSKTRLAKDVRQAGASEQSWEMEVTADEAGKVTLTWPGIARLPRRLSLTLRDKDSGRTYAMRSTSATTINLAKGGVGRFVITAKTQKTQPLTITGLQAISTRVGGGHTFSFNLSREATVTAQVKTVTGKTVATLASGRSVNAGQSRLSWTGRAANGGALPPGPYMVEIVAQGEEGESASTRQPFLMNE